MRKQVIEFLQSEPNPDSGFLKPRNGGYEEDQFFAGLKMVDPEGNLQLEELLLKLVRRLNEDNPVLCNITNNVFRRGVLRLLWAIHDSIKKVDPAYAKFAAWLGTKSGRYGIISFNWDLQAELLLTQANVPWSYSLGLGIPVIKPHGSVNWNSYLRDGLVAHSSSWQPIRQGSKLSYIRKTPIENPHLDEVLPQLIYSVFPGDSDHPESYGDLKLLWSDATTLIDTAVEVVFIGYSFPAYDLCASQFFKSHIQGKNAVAVNPSCRDLKRIESILGGNVELLRQKFEDCPYAQRAN